MKCCRKGVVPFRICSAVEVRRAEQYLLTYCGQAAITWHPSASLPANQGELLDDCIMRDGAWSCLTAANEWQRCNLGATPAPTDAQGQLLVAQVRGWGSWGWVWLLAPVMRLARGAPLVLGNNQSMLLNPTAARAPPHPPLPSSLWHYLRPAPIPQRATTTNASCLLPAVYGGNLWFDCVKYTDGGSTADICPTAVRHTVWTCRRGYLR